MRQTSRILASASRSITYETSAVFKSSRISYTCSTCRAALRSPTNRQDYTRRNFTTTRQSFQSDDSPKQHSQSSQTNSQQITHYTLFPKSFPNGPPPASPFLPDLRALRSEFLALQTRTHPDRFPASEKLMAEARSAALNDAYRTLADPLRHANYLLTQNGIDTEDESAKLEDPALLMEVMEAREAVDEVEAEEELDPLMEENKERIEESVRTIDELVQGKRWEEAGREAVKLRYWRNVEESIRGWEKGSGGGMVHH